MATTRARAGSAGYASASDDGGDFDDWGSADEDAAITSLLSPPQAGSPLPLPTAAAAWDELRAATGFDYAAWRRTPSGELCVEEARAGRLCVPLSHPTRVLRHFTFPPATRTSRSTRTHTHTHTPQDHPTRTPPCG